MAHGLKTQSTRLSQYSTLLSSIKRGSKKAEHIKKERRGHRPRLSFLLSPLKKKNRHLRKSRDGEVEASDPVGIRTQDPQLRRLLLYPAELRNQHYERKGSKIIVRKKTKRDKVCSLPCLLASHGGQDDALFRHNISLCL